MIGIGMMIGTAALNALYPSLATAGVALVGVAISRIGRMIGIQQDAAANAAIQNAVGNFAGKIVSDIHAGHLTMEDVRNGAVLGKLLTYAYETVGDSLQHAGVSDATLQTMLVGKVAAISAAPVVSASLSAAPAAPVQAVSPAVAGAAS